MLLVVVGLAEAMARAILIEAPVAQINAAFINDLLILLVVHRTEAILGDLAVALSSPPPVPLPAVAESGVKGLVRQCWVVHPGT